MKTYLPHGNRCAFQPEPQTVPHDWVVELSNGDVAGLAPGTRFAHDTTRPD